MGYRRLARTLADLTASQVAHQAYYRLSRSLSRRPRESPKYQWGIRHRPPDISASISEAFAPPATFRFLNREATFATPAEIDWDDLTHGKLFAYHLNYFDWLSGAPDRDAAEAILLAHARYAPARSNKYEPYPTSLRLVNVVYAYARWQRTPPPDILVDLHRGYHDLWRKREFHLSGNHLLENAIALCVGAHAFGDRAHQDASDDFLARQLRDQYLPSGLHYERSLTYHGLLAYRQLLALACLDACAPRATSTSLLRASLGPQLRALAEHVPSAQAYPRFNDVDPAGPPTPAALCRFAEALGVATPEAPPPAEANADGLLTRRRPRYTLTFDAGAFGPAHIPGHAHDDALSFVLYAPDGRELLTDVGTSTYEASATRHRERGVSAHNTVAFAGGGQSESWGAFRVGRKPTVRLLRDEPSRLLAHLSTGDTGARDYVHRREVSLGPDAITIIDSAAAFGPGAFAARYHLPPGVSATATPGGVNAESGLSFRFAGATRWNVGDYEYAVGFNDLRPARVIVAAFDHALTTTIVLS